MEALMAENSIQNEVFKLKGRLFTLTVLELYPARLENFEQAISDVYNKAPNMFAHTPIVLDLKKLKGSSFDLKGIADIMRRYQMVPVGVQHASQIQQKAAAAAGLSVLLSRDGNESKSLDKALQAAQEGAVVSNSIKHRKSHEPELKAVKPEIKPEMKSEPSPTRVSKVVTQPVRSGQQIYAKGADLIVLSSVGTGAELLADGHIHVYGTLRGRALAGIQGDKTARIFCSNLEAELVSIAGQYLMLEAGHRETKAKQIMIVDERLKILDL